MSARLKLKKLKREIKFMYDDCERRKADALCIERRCAKLIQENIIEISAIVELWPCDMMRHAVDCLNSNVNRATAAIVRKYAEQLAEYVRNQLTTKYALRKFSTFGIRLLAPKLNETHIQIDIKEAAG